MPRASTVRPVRFTYDDPDLSCRRVRGVGFSASCGCGATSGRVASVGMARGWLREHARGCSGSRDPAAT